MSTLQAIIDVALIVGGLGQAVLLSLQLRALRKYSHKSFGVLAAGTALGLISTVLGLLISLAPSVLPAPQRIYFVAVVLGTIQVPVAVWGVAWLFLSYGQMHLREQTRVA
jgi:uncharacterized membrane protein